MQSSKPFCDSETIENYLVGNMTPEQAETFESHVNTCDACRQSLEEQSAEPEIWSNALELLAQDEVLTAGSTSSSSQPAGHPAGLNVLDSLMPTDDPEMLGRLGEYEISGVVGIGGMGAVLRGFDKSLRRVVAIKVMAPHLAGSGPARMRFQREARAAAAITHDNVIDIYGVSEANGIPYLVMPYARGPSLQKRIDQGGPLSAIEVVRIGRQIASGLAAAHEQGLVHRDIKPANILLNEGIERLWITDFGVARAIDDASMTQTGLIAGTPQYMSPEQARGETVDHRSDLFSLGSILYTACTGRPPFRSEAAYGVLRRITDSDPRPIREINAEIPDWLCHIIDRLMAKHPADRFETAQEVANGLEGCLAHLQQPTLVDLPPRIAAAKNSKTADRAQGLLLPRTSQVPTRSLSVRTLGVLSMMTLTLLVASGVFAFQLTSPAQIAGTWSGEQWKNVQLKNSVEAPGWYTGEFVDASGSRGVLQLEWSRTQRRFQGRWQIGADKSGPITLRTDQQGNVRGAVTFDADATIPPDTLRLRDFVWQRGKVDVVDRQTGTENPLILASSFPIRSQLTGTIKSVSDGLQEGGVIEKGQLILTIQPDMQRSPVQYKLMFDEAKQRVKDAEQLLAARIGELDIAERTLQAARTRVNDYVEARTQLKVKANAEVRSAENALEAALQKVGTNQASLLTIKQDLEAKEQLAAEGAITQSEVELARRKLGEAEGKLKETQIQVQGSELAIESKKAEMEGELRQAKIKISDAMADANAAETEVARVSTMIVQSRSERDSAERALNALEAEMNEMSRPVQVIAPFDGTIHQWGLRKRVRVAEGEVLFQLVPKDEKPQLPANPAEANPESQETTPVAESY